MAEAPKETPAKAAEPGGMKAWLPLILTFFLMPALAYAMTLFILVPRMEKALGGKRIEAREAGGSHASSAAEAHGSDSSAAGHGSSQGGDATGAGGSKNRVPLGKNIVVNVAGSLGTRMLLVSLTLVGNSPDLKTRVEEEADQLRDLASGVLGTKTISDLEKPEARNLIRTELISQFNAVLGSGVVKEIFFPEFAIQ